MNKKEIARLKKGDLILDDSIVNSYNVNYAYDYIICKYNKIQQTMVVDVKYKIKDEFFQEYLSVYDFDSMVFYSDIFREFVKKRGRK